MRLARSSTCSSLLILNQTYENNSYFLFERDLDLAFFYSEGFDEVVYRRAYNQINRGEYHQSETIDIIDLTTNEESRVNNQDSDLITNEESRVNDQDSYERLNEGNKSS